MDGPEISYFQADGMEMSDLEDLARRSGVRLCAVCFVRNCPDIRVRVLRLGNMAVSSASALEVLALQWREPTGSVNLSVCPGDAQLLLEGRERPNSSVVVYSETSNGVWAGQLVPSKSRKHERAYHISLPLEEGRELGIPSQFLNRSWFQFQIDPQVARDFAVWMDRQESPERAPSARLFAELRGWITRLLEPVGVKPIEPVSPSHYPRIIGAVSDCLPSLNGPISVTRLANEVNVSTRTLQRAFHSTFGVGAKRFLRTQQLRRAHELLRSGDYSVASAAYSVGIPHASRFSQEYFAHFGVYPSETMVARASSGA